MTIIINQEIFEKAVPSMRNATDEVFNAIAQHLDEAKAEVTNLIGTLTTEEQTEELLNRATHLACLIAAHRAMPHLDLVLTPTGFGVVSNQNVAPASRERVATLAERLRRDKSIERDLLIFELLKTSWTATPQAAALINSLLWCPMMCRRSGVTLEGKQVYHEEQEQLWPRIAEAEHIIAESISPELYTALIKRQYSGGEEDRLYTLLQEKCRRIIATILYGGKIRLQMTDLLDTVRKNRDLLPEYGSSSTAAAHDFAPYENQKKDGTFFFG